MKNNKPLIRRTFRQERFDILIKKQRNGSATFNDLTELDDIVNRDPAILESILEEMQEQNHPGDRPQREEIVIIDSPEPKSLLQRLKAFVNGVFNFNGTGFMSVARGKTFSLSL